MRTRTQQENEVTTKASGLLSARLFNAIPYSSSVKGFYIKTKQSNDTVKFGLNLAENVVSAIPFVQRVGAIDRFANSQLSKIEVKYDIDLVTKSVSAVAFPIGYSLGLAQYARDKVVGLTTPAVDLTYEIADALIDKLLPANYDETLIDENRYKSALQHKSPFRRIRDRATVNSIVRLPSTALLLSKNMVYSTMYMGMGFATASFERLLLTATTIIKDINVNFKQDLVRPWTVVSNGDFTKLYKASLFYGAKYVNGLIEEVEQQAAELSEYLQNRQMPYNSKAVEFVAHKLKGIERRLIRVGGIHFTPTEETVRVLPVRTITKSRDATPLVSVTPSKRNLPELRTASMITGDTVSTLGNSAELRTASIMTGNTLSELPEASASIITGDTVPQTLDAEPTEHIEHPAEHHINLHKAGLMRLKTPSMMWGPEQPLTKRHPFPKKPEEFVGEEVVFDNEAPVKKAHKPKVHHHKSKPIENEAVEIHVEPAVEEVDPNADAHGFVTVKAPTHGHLIPLSTAQRLGKQMLHRKVLPATPANSPAEPINNPFSEIDVEGSSVLRGPEVVDSHFAKAREVENRAHEKHLRSKALHELLLKLAEVKLKEEKRAEAHSVLWEQPKHAVHVHSEHHAEHHVEHHGHHAEHHAHHALGHKTHDAAENNPFEKLAEVEADQDPFTMGASTM